MAITREILKSEIDRVREEHLSVLFKIIQALEEPALRAGIQEGASRWKQFVADAYGSLADAPVEAQAAAAGREERRLAAWNRIKNWVGRRPVRIGKGLPGRDELHER